ncbi:MAG: CRISPR-associated endonuclease Cas1 [Candidatus Saccharicenans sp.]|nr:CRISPR-associated endonuclease Cas1 [Candidatus Saccharicenans sp.]
MGTLYIDQKDSEIRIEGNCLVFFENGNRKGTVPLNPLERVIIIGNMKIETIIFHRLAQSNISCVFLSGRNLAFRGRLHGRLHRNGLLRLRQYEKSLSPVAQTIAKDLIKFKLEKQKDLLTSLIDYNPGAKYELIKAITTISQILDSIPLQSDLESLLGLEGSAAASYFHALSFVFPASLNFHGRNRRPPRDPVNSLLSLGYTLLHFEIVREIELAGFDPTIGFLHQFEYGRESLACDLSEPFRPDIDKMVFNLIRERQLKETNFSYHKEQGLQACYLKKNSRKIFFEYYENWARVNRAQWAEKVRALARWVMQDEISVC